MHLHIYQFTILLASIVVNAIPTPVEEGDGTLPAFPITSANASEGACLSPTPAIFPTLNTTWVSLEGTRQDFRIVTCDKKLALKDSRIWLISVPVSNYILILIL